MWGHLESQHGLFKDWMISLAERLRGEMSCYRGDGQWLGRHGISFLNGTCHKHTVRILIIAAHPDDESIGISSIIRRHVQLGHCVRVVFATNGRGHWRQPIQRARRIVTMRQAESMAALSTIGVGEDHILYCGYPDGGLYRYLSDLFMDVSWVIRQVRPDMVLVHAIEGGHVDHDTLALMTSYAVSENLSSVYEWVEYNRHQGLGVATHQFISEGASIHSLSLTPHEWNAKRQMLECYTSQNVAARCAGQKEYIRAAAPFSQQWEVFHKVAQGTSPSRRMLVRWLQWLSHQSRRSVDSIALQGGPSQAGQLRC